MPSVRFITRSGLDILKKPGSPVTLSSQRCTLCYVTECYDTMSDEPDLE
jgi:hypothetical protein